MTPEEVRSLYDYNAWANRRVLDACAALSEEQSSRAIVSSFPSVRDTLQHIFGAEYLWFERWHGRSHTAIPPAEDANLAALRSRWEKIDADVLKFVRGLSAEDLDRVHSYRNTAGKEFSNPMKEMLQHLANHGTYHRGQVITMLRQLGAAPAATDMIVYYRERAAAAHN
ncbi:MAG TPA: DinB family protein [Candidatus Acidoferrales bacterium]|nr:DinB family protein [Candidatus Acidoferrales bacterium]